MRRRATLVLGVLVLTGGTALAQDRPEVSAGWRLLHISGSEAEDISGTEDDGVNLPKGWYFDVAVPITPMFSIVGDIGGNYKSESVSFTEQGLTFSGTAKVSLHTFLGGIRLRRIHASLPSRRSCSAPREAPPASRRRSAARR